MSTKLENRIEKAKRQVEYFKNKVENFLKEDPEAKNKPEFRILKKKLRRAQRKLRKYIIMQNKVQSKNTETESE